MSEGLVVALCFYMLTSVLLSIVIVTCIDEKDFLSKRMLLTNPLRVH